jgi:hypothetical protein
MEALAVDLLHGQEQFDLNFRFFDRSNGCLITSSVFFGLDRKSVV